MARRFMFPDVNVVVDAAESVFRMWADQVSKLDSLGLTESTRSHLVSRESAVDFLSRSRLIELADLVASGKVPLGALQAKASGLRLAAVLKEDPSPQWLVEMLTAHEDPRVSDLAQHTAEGRVVTTDRVLEASAMVLNKRRGVPLEVSQLLVGAFVRGVEVVEVGCSLREAVAGGLLRDLLDQVRDGASENLADIDEVSDTWCPRTAARDLPVPEGSSPRAHRRTHHEVFGVDGEDLYLLHQVRLCQEALTAVYPDSSVVLSTSDYHLFNAAPRARVCASMLYSWTESGIVSTQMEPSVTRRRVEVAAPVMGMAL